MPAERKGLWDTFRQGALSEEEKALSFLFPAKNKFEYLQMLGEHPVRSNTPYSVLGVFRRKYKSKVLESFQYEMNVNSVGQERKGRLEGSEVVVGMRKSKEDKED